MTAFIDLIDFASIMAIISITVKIGVAIFHCRSWTFSHKICPECARKQYPDLFDPAKENEAVAPTVI